jgi:hypothetical protein
MENDRNPPQSQARQPHPSPGGVSGLGDSDQARGMGQRSRFTGGASPPPARSRGRRLPEQIRPRMEVVDDLGRHCGTVDHCDGDQIKLTRADSRDGRHHYIALTQVAGIEGNQVRLRERGDNDFGMEGGR